MVLCADALAHCRILIDVERVLLASPLRELRPPRFLDFPTTAPSMEGRRLRRRGAVMKSAST